MAVFKVSTQINLLFTDYLEDKDAIRYACTNKHFHEYLLKSYKCKEFYDSEKIAQKTLAIMTKIRNVSNFDFIQWHKDITHLEFNKDFIRSLPNIYSLDKLTHITFHGPMHEQIQLENLPKNLSYLQFEWSPGVDLVKLYGHVKNITCLSPSFDWMCAS